MYRHHPVPSRDRARTPAPSRRARSLTAAPLTPLWSPDFANPDRDEHLIDGATMMDDANRRGAHSARRARPSTGKPTGGGARQIAYLPLAHLPNLRSSLVPREEPEALWCPPAARSYVDTRNPP